MSADLTPTPYPCPRTSGRGFTLFELLVVLVVLLLVAGIGVPALTGGGGIELKAAARTLAAGLRHTRQQALSDRQPRAFTLDVEARWYQLATDTRVRSLPANLGLKLFTARSELDGEGRGSIRFFPDGSSTGGRITVSRTKSQHGARIFVDVDWLTGRVRVLETQDETSTGYGWTEVADG